MFQCVCGTGNNILTDQTTGETCCSKCGLVLRNGSEVSSYLYHHDDNITASTRHAPLPRHNLAATRTEFKGRLKRTNDMLVSNSDTRAIKTEISIRNCCEKLGLPTRIRERAMTLFHKIRPVTKHSTISSTASALIFAACRENNITRTLKEICRTMESDYGTAKRSYSKICMVLTLDIKPVDQAGFVTRICSDLQLPEKTTRKSLSVLKKVKKLDCSYGKSPLTISAYAVYAGVVSDGVMVTQAEIAEAAGITPVSLRNMRKVFQGVTEKILP